jgi:hypothetical protein
MLWLALVLFIALATAMLRGGRLTNLADIRLRQWWLLPLGFVIQAAGTWGVVPWSRGVSVGLVLASYVPLLILVVLNRERSGMWLAGVGVLMNFTVIALNGGMPVLEEAARIASGGSTTAAAEITTSAKHVMMSLGTRLPALGDVIPIRIVGQGSVVSLGDVFLAVGLARFLEAELRRPVRWFKHGASTPAGSAARR